MATYDLGKVVGDAGEKGDDGSTVWNTSTAPTYANSKYTFTISNLSGKTGLEIAVNDIIFYSTYYYIVSAVNTTTVDCTTRISIKGSDASVTIVDNLTSTSSTSALSAKQGKVLNDNKIETSSIATSFGSTTSDSKVPSEKLTKDTLDTKIAKSSTTGLVKNDGSIMTGGTGSSNWAIGNHTHSGYVSATKVTSWSSTVSDSNVPSEKLVKNTIDGLSIPTKTSDLTNDGDGTNAFLTQHQSLTNYIQKSSTSGLVKNDGTIDTSTYLTSSALSNYVQKSSTNGLLKNDGTVDTTSYSTFSGSYSDLSNKPSIPSSSSDLSDGSDLVKKSSTSGLLKNDGSVMTGGTGSSNYAIGNHTHSNYISTSSTTGLVKNDGSIDTNSYLTSSAISGMLTTSDIANNLTTTTTGKVLDASQGKALADLIGDAITYINQ